MWPHEVLTYRKDNRPLRRGRAGFVTREEFGSYGGLARRFAAAAIGLLLVSALLTNYLVGLVHNLRSERAINAVLDEALAQEPNTALVSVEFSRGAAGVDVLSTVRTPRVLMPETVKHIQDSLSARLGEPVRLFMRCAVTKDVTATGSTNVRPYLSLNGKVTEAPLAPEMRALQVAEQVAREVASTRPGLIVDDIEYVHLPSGPVFLISINSAREPSAADVASFEAVLRKRLEDPTVRVVVRKAASSDTTSKGRILFGAAHFSSVDDADAVRREAVEDAVRADIGAIPDLFVTAADAIRRDPGWAVRAEVVGPRVLTPAEVRQVEDRVATAVGESVELAVQARIELLVTGTRYEPIGGVPEETPPPTPAN